MKVISSQVGNRVLVKQSDAITKVGTIFIPASLTEKPLEGIVSAVSEHYLCAKNGTVPPIVKKGDTVLYQKDAGSPVTINGNEYIMLMEYNIFAIL